MIERLIANWLTNVNELGYQLPFCQVLLSQGHSVIHISRHGRGEHGKDVVARAKDGKLWTYQLKGGDIGLPEWRQIRGEVEELVRLPVRRPGIRKSECHIPVLVTNGEIIGDAIENIRYFAEEWERDGAPALQVWTRDEILRMFVDAHHSYLPKELNDFRAFVELYVSDFEDRLPRSAFSHFLSNVAKEHAIGKRRLEVKRAIESIVLIASYIIERYERAENWISAAEGWTVVAATIFYIVEAENVRETDYRSSLALATLGFERDMERFEADLFSREHLLEGRHVFAEPFVLGARTSLVLGWASAAALRRRLMGELVSSERLIKVIKRESTNMRFLGEADWPAVISLALFVEFARGSLESEALLSTWINWIVRSNSGEEPPGIPSPYWLPEDVLRLRADEIAPDEKENFSRHTYTAHHALEMLVRRLYRQRVRHLWPQVSRLQLCDFHPGNHADWFLWRTPNGRVQLVNPVQPQSWGKWRDQAAHLEEVMIPMCLRRHPEWTLPFALTYPHRVNELLAKFIDSVIGRRVRILAINSSSRRKEKKASAKGKRPARTPA